MTKAKANNIEIEYDTFGSPSSKPLLLVAGLGTQMIWWREEFCEKLVDKGFFVIRFDNRDVGLSTKVSAPYNLQDMADDAISLLDALNVDKAHICGASMGGSIIQEMAIKYPARILSLTSIMSTTGRAGLPPPKPEAIKLLMMPAPEERDGYIEYYENLWRVLHGTGFPFDEKEGREMAAKSYDRSFYPPGIDRQVMAISTSGSRKTKLASVSVPTQIIHGGDDPVVSVEGGKDTAETIQGAELLIIEGMGHALPREAWSQIIDAISANADKAKP